MFSWISLYKSILTGVSTWLALAVNLAVTLSFVDETHNQSSHNREDNRNAGRYRSTLSRVHRPFLLLIVLAKFTSAYGRFS